nr:MoxR family ATPase [Bacilli bacterium]
MEIGKIQERAEQEGSLPTIQHLIDNIKQVIVGKEKVIRLLLVALISRGHVLVEDVPGVGKTMLVRSLAKSLACDFKRIQFTPDLLPSDVTGTAIFNQRSGDFEYREGPIFSQIVLADEINRTSPKTQSALLEALEEHSVSFDGVTHALPQPFFVLATQNPIEYEGTFPLPEAQLDRFLLKVSLGYPTKEEEEIVLTRGTQGIRVDTLQAVIQPTDILAWQEAAEAVYIDPTLLRYIIEIAHKTREHEKIYLGVSPRASIALAKAAKAYAFTFGRSYVIPDDLKALFEPVFTHRLLLHPEARLQGYTPLQLLSEIIEHVEVPVFVTRS